MFETAASNHTPAWGLGGQGVLTLHVVIGDVVLYDANGDLIGTENWKTVLERYLAYCERTGVAPRDLTASS